LTQGRIVAVHGWFNCIHQVVPLCTGVSNTWVLGTTATQHPKLRILIGTAVFVQFAAQNPLQRAATSLKIVHLRGESGT